MPSLTRTLAAATATMVGATLLLAPNAHAANGDLLYRGTDVDNKTMYVKHGRKKAIKLTIKGSATASYYEASYLEGNLCSVLSSPFTKGTQKKLRKGISQKRPWSQFTSNDNATSCETTGDIANGDYKQDVTYTGKYTLRSGSKTLTASPRVLVQLTGGYQYGPMENEYIVQIRKAGSWKFKQTKQDKKKAERKKNNRGNKGGNGTVLKPSIQLPSTGSGGGGSM